MHWTAQPYSKETNTMAAAALTEEQKSLALDVLGLAKCYVRGDEEGFNAMLSMLSNNSELESVIGALLGHYMVACMALGRRDGLDAAQVIDRAHCVIVGSQVKGC
jgi:hypothetical protein